MADSISEHDEMLDGEDDCVIFKGSPLYDSLVQSGSLAEELEIERKVFDKTEVQDTCKRQEIKPNRYSCWALVKSFWNACCEKLKLWSSPDMSPIYLDHHHCVINELSMSACLEEDDGDFVRFYIQSCGGLTYNHKTCRRIVRLAFDIIICLAAISVNQYLSWKVANSRLPWSSVTIATVVGIVIYVGFRESRGYIHRQKCKTVWLIYDDFIKKNEKIAVMVKKCLRLIQESELIARGFTLVSQRNPLSRLEGGQKDTSTRQCPVLRKLLFTVAREAVLFYREMLKRLFDIYPLSAELDIQGTYLAYEPIQNYGPCLQTDTEDAEQLHSVTDGFSISSLKAVSHLFSLHQSEFMKALIIIQQERMGKEKNITEFKELNVLKDISTRLEGWTVSLQKSHDYYSCTWMDREPVKREPSSQSDIEDIYIAIHSLDLHLQAALKRVRYLSEFVQGFSGAGQTDSQLNDLLNHMQPIRAELESSKGCWEEGINRIEKAAGKSSFKANETLLKDDESAIDVTPTTDMSARKIEDYIIEDQVFEGYTDPAKVTPDYEWDKPMTEEEKEKKRREKEESLRMLSELKAVISVRAVETEKRETAAILKMYPNRRCSENVNSQPKTNTICKSELAESGKTRLSSGHGAEEQEMMKNDEKCESSNTKYTLLCSEERSTPECINKQNEGNSAGMHGELKGSVVAKDKEVFSEHDPVAKGNTHSVISGQGVRRLRKSNMLDLSDSDLEDYPQDNEQENFENEENISRLGLPLRKLTETKNSVDEVKDISDIVPDEMKQLRLPVLTLQERLENLSGAKLSLTSEIAEKAVARYKVMGLREETTFGGDVYGEYSSSTDNESVGDDDEA